ncbi:MAG: MarR family transcriptional regulator [Deltaproteobacteria bacterium]|jgi:DNA-binding MarR family transcriptional regulator|nr:MarR family transcriptional regulator [Deltaproteobacteria bacterium]
MNHIKGNNPSEISKYQIQQFQTLVTKLFQCCQERVQYQCERFELPDAELRCLMLFDEERYLTSKGIAYKMNVVKSRVTKIINGLVKKKFVQRVPDPEDSRITLLSLTPEGQRKLNDIKSFYDYVNYQVLMQMEPEQRKTMLTNLDLLKASMEAVKEMMV